MIRFGSKSRNDPPYQLYDNEGGEVLYTDAVQPLAEARVFLFGELHNRAVVHVLQYEITRELYEAKKGKLVLGAEMFEADNQLILDEYLFGRIKHEHLVSEAKVWDNYEPDYRPLVEFAKEQGLPFRATNIPRRYANLVAREGTQALNTLSEEAKRYMAPLPIQVDLATPGYQEVIEMSRGHGMQMKPENFVAAQAVKDATMAHFILKHVSAESLFIHYHGDYHSRRYGGIYWYLKEADPQLLILTLSSVESGSLEFKDEFRGLADYVLVVPPG
jgi:uncharacterized iron-regulated protein